MSNFNTNIEKQLSDLGKEIQQFVEKLVPVDRKAGDFTPDCDVIESSDAYKILIDLPGIDKKQVKVSMKNRVLTVEGDRELELEDGETLEREERKQGAFIRSFAIPEYADSDSIEASFNNGVLKIEISKSGSDTNGKSTIPIQ